MRMIPSVFPPIPADVDPKKKAGLTGEKQVYDLLKQVDRPGFVTYSSTLLKHRFKKVAEADFIVVVEEGVFVLEVKASSNLRRASSSGQWLDEKRVIESPWEQAAGAMYSVRKHFNEQSMEWGPLDGFGVVLLKTSFPRDQTSIDIESRTVMDRHQVQQGVNGMTSFLEGMIGYWISGHKSRKGYPPKRLNIENLDEIESYLAPSLDLRPSLSDVSGDIRQTLDELTAEQYRVVKKHREDRKVIEGGAGTGKTFVAVELCKDLSNAGEQVGLVVKSVGLARFLRSRISDTNVGVHALRELEDKQEDGEGPSFDIMVVDEGQDLLNEDSLEILERALEGGMTAGRWRWFMDPNNQAGLHGEMDSDVLDFIRDAADGAAWPLDENCRNTAPMVEELKSRLDADLGSPNPDAIGPSPKISTSGKNAAETQAKRLTEGLRDLYGQGVEPGSVSVIAVCKEEYLQTMLANLPADLASTVRRFTSTDLDAWPPRGVTAVMLPSEIKGLENDHVIVMEGDDLAADAIERRTGIYVGMTRGRTSLRAHLRRDLDSFTETADS